MLGERTGVRWQDGTASPIKDTVAVETVYQLFLDGSPLNRSVVSPADLREWGAGYVICEGLLPPGELAGVELEGEQVRVRSRTGSGAERPELLVKRSSDYLGRPGNELQPITSDLKIAPDQIEAYAKALSELASGWRQTGGLHAAILYDEQGRLVKLAEDIGRHNAVDKVVGAAHLKGIETGRCAVVISGRMPQGMVAKIIRAGIPVAITKAASTELGIDTARRCHLTLVCFARPGRFTVYSAEERVLL